MVLIHGMTVCGMKGTQLIRRTVWFIDTVSSLGKSNNLENKYLSLYLETMSSLSLTHVYDLIMHFVFMPSESYPQNDTVSDLSTNASV